MTPSSIILLPSSMALTLGWFAYAIVGRALWLLGYPDQALKRSTRLSPWPGSSLTL